MDRPICISGRRQGNTTRLADWYIQQLFETQKGIKIYDVSSLNYINLSDNIEKHQYLMNKHLFGIIVRRLQGEHEHLFDKLKIDKEMFTINWIK